MKFYMTFPCVHPLHDGWIEIEASSWDIARRLIDRHFGKYFSGAYGEKDFIEDIEKKYYPLGKLGDTLREGGWDGI